MVFKVPSRWDERLDRRTDGPLPGLCGRSSLDVTVALAAADCVSEPELDFDPATQGELDLHTHPGEDIDSGTV